MIHCNDFDRVAARYNEYWHSENHDRSIMTITAPAANRRPAPEFKGTLRERWLDTECALKRMRYDLENTHFAGEAFPTAIPNLNGIQWLYGAGQPGAAHWIDVIRRIRCAGKIVHIEAAPADIPALLEALPPEGILYNISCSSPEDADALLKIAENTRSKKIF